MKANTQFVLYQPLFKSEFTTPARRILSALDPLKIISKQDPRHHFARPQTSTQELRNLASQHLQKIEDLKNTHPLLKDHHKNNTESDKVVIIPKAHDSTECLADVAGSDYMILRQNYSYGAYISETSATVFFSTAQNRLGEFKNNNTLKFGFDFSGEKLLLTSAEITISNHAITDNRIRPAIKSDIDLIFESLYLNTAAILNSPHLLRIDLATVLTMMGFSVNGTQPTPNAGSQILKPEISHKLPAFFFKPNQNHTQLELQENPLSCYKPKKPLLVVNFDNKDKFGTKSPQLILRWNALDFFKNDNITLWDVINPFYQSFQLFLDNTFYDNIFMPTKVRSFEEFLKQSQSKPSYR